MRLEIPCFLRKREGHAREIRGSLKCISLSPSLLFALLVAKSSNNKGGMEINAYFSVPQIDMLSRTRYIRRRKTRWILHTSSFCASQISNLITILVEIKISPHLSLTLSMTSSLLSHVHHQEKARADRKVKEGRFDDKMLFTAGFSGEIEEERKPREFLFYSADMYTQALDPWKGTKRKFLMVFMAFSSMLLFIHAKDLGRGERQSKFIMILTHFLLTTIKRVSSWAWREPRTHADSNVNGNLNWMMMMTMMVEHRKVGVYLRDVWQRRLLQLPHSLL